MKAECSRGERAVQVHAGGVVKGSDFSGGRVDRARAVRIALNMAMTCGVYEALRRTDDVNTRA